MNRDRFFTFSDGSHVAHLCTLDDKHHVTLLDRSGVVGGGTFYTYRMALFYAVKHIRAYKEVHDGHQSRIVSSETRACP